MAPGRLFMLRVIVHVDGAGAGDVSTVVPTGRD
jgi:hypothetical protein